MSILGMCFAFMDRTSRMFGIIIAQKKAGCKQKRERHLPLSFSSMNLLTADNSQHFADILHGLGQVLHHLHIPYPPEIKVWFVSYRVPMQAFISPIDCMALIIFFFIVINNTSQNECELFSVSRRERCSAQPGMAVL
jgi:hypothetical protein